MLPLTNLPAAMIWPDVHSPAWVMIPSALARAACSASTLDAVTSSASLVTSLLNSARLCFWVASKAAMMTCAGSSGSSLATGVAVGRGEMVMTSLSVKMAEKQACYNRYPHHRSQTIFAHVGSSARLKKAWDGRFPDVGGIFLQTQPATADKPPVWCAIRPPMISPWQRT